jgi:hypothetical protein
MGSRGVGFDSFVPQRDSQHPSPFFDPARIFGIVIVQVSSKDARGILIVPRAVARTSECLVPDPIVFLFFRRRRRERQQKQHN